MKTPHERALDRLTLLAPRMHLTGLMPDVILRSLEAVEEARDVLALIEARPDSHQLVSVPALKAAIARVDAVVTG